MKERRIYHALYTNNLYTRLHVIEVLQGEKELNEIASSYNLNSNMLRTWKKEFIENAGRLWSEHQVEKDIRRKEASLEQERNAILKTIGQLTLVRDFLQD